jgi:hypothetical protein
MLPASDFYLAQLSCQSRFIPICIALFPAGPCLSYLNPLQITIVFFPMLLDIFAIQMDEVSRLHEQSSGIVREYGLLIATRRGQPS